MDRFRDSTRVFFLWAQDFLFGDYRGAPVDYLMAIAAVYAAMVVLVARNLMEMI